MECINAASLHRKIGAMGHPAFVDVEEIQKVTTSQDDDSVGVLTKTP